jgi:hypothetical protein
MNCRWRHNPSLPLLTCCVQNTQADERDLLQSPLPLNKEEVSAFCLLRSYHKFKDNGHDA